MPSRRAIAAGPSFSSRRRRSTSTALIDGWRPLYTAPLGGTDPLQLALAAQIGLELREHPQHVKKRLAGCRASVDRLSGRLQGDTLGLELMHDVLEVFQGTRQTVDARDGQK